MTKFLDKMLATGAAAACAHSAQEGRWAMAGALFAITVMSVIDYAKVRP
jgi:hypothetical protein